MTLTFYKDILYTIGTGAGIATSFYTLKTSLVTAGWTVMSSGTGSSYSSNSDLITSATVLNNANAWYRIRAPVGTKEFIFQRVAGENAWRMKMCLNGFTGGSPSATVVPTGDATDTLVYGSGTDGSPTGANVTIGTGGLAQRAHICVASGTDGYGWYLISNDSGTATRQFHIMMDSIDGYSQISGDPDPYIYTFIGYATGNGINVPGSVGRISIGTGGTGVYAFWSSSTAALDVTAIAWYIQYQGSYNYTLVPSGIAVNPWNGKDEAFPIFWARNPGRTGVGGYRGASTFQKWVGYNRGTGNTFSINTTSDRYAYSDTSLPWDGTTPNI